MFQVLEIAKKLFDVMLWSILGLNANESNIGEKRKKSG